MTLLLNMVVDFGYWSLVHKHAMIKHPENPERFQMYLLHINPTISWLLLWLSSEVRMVDWHCLILVPCGLVYMAVNFLATKMRDRPLYPFMTWESIPGTLLICFALMAGFLGIYVAAARLANYFKGEFGQKSSRVKDK